MLGSTMLSESLSEYVSLKIIESVNGKNKMRKFLKRSLDTYLTDRTFERKRENALMYNTGKGTSTRASIFMLRLYWKHLNQALSTYKKTAFQEPPYTTSSNLLMS